MRTGLTAPSLVVLCLLVASPDARTADGAQRCKPRGAGVVTANERVRVYRVRQMTYACHLGTGRRMWLGDVPFSNGPTSIDASRIRVAGDLVGYAHEISREESIMSIRVKSVRTGRVIRNADAVSQMVRPDTRFRPEVTDLELTRGGDVGWIARNVSLDPVQLEVFKIDGEGRQRVDVGPDVDRASLASSGSTMHWSRAGQPRSARFR